MKIRVGVFFGGRSVEHEVSVISGLQAFAALDKQKYDAIPVYITKEGHFYTGPNFGGIAAYRDIPALLRSGDRVLPASADGRAVLVRHPAKRLGGNVLATIDIAMPVVHGTNAEDGALQGFLEMLNIPYTGPDVLSAALCMDKAASKTLLRDAGLPVLPALTVSAFNWIEHPDAEVRRVEGEFAYPVVVKPVNLGSSVGITLASTREALCRALDLGFKFAAKALVEPAVVSLREINCAVLGDAEETRASVCEEPVGGGDILSYQDKYLSSGKQAGMQSARRRIPAELPEGQAKAIQALAVKTFQALGCGGVARVDFLLDRETSNVYVNEINAIPGSLSFYLWEPVGVSFPKLLDEMLSLALKRRRERGNLSFAYETNILAGVTLGGKKSGKL